MKPIITLIFLFISVLPAFSQSNDNVQLAYSYYNNKEYDKAAYLFEELFNQ